MYEYLVLAVVTIIAFIAQYIYVLGKLSGEIQSCKDNVEWIRDFLLTKCTNGMHFNQESAIKMSEELEKSIPLSWQDTLDIAGIDVEKCKNAIDCVVALSKSQGPIRLKKQAERLEIPHNDFLLASGVYLYNKFHKKRNEKKA